MSTLPTESATRPTSPNVANRRPAAALLGNPNTGKSTLFNALSGLQQRVGNYPGVTVETKTGQMVCNGKSFDLIDLPGTYSLAARSPDEMVAVDVILGHQAGVSRPEVVICLADASNLDRNLYLTAQALELGVPVVVALNMIDVAESQGIRIDADKLSAGLGVPVIPIQANKRRGLEQLRAAVAQAALGAAPATGATFPNVFNQEVATLQGEVGREIEPFLVRRLLLDVGGYTERRLIERFGPKLAEQTGAARARLLAAQCKIPAVEMVTRYAWIRGITAHCVQRPAKRSTTWTDRIDRVLTHKVYGTIVFLLLMFAVFQAIFSGARPIMKVIDFGKGWLIDTGNAWLPPGPFTSLLLDGVVNGVGAVVVFLPQILILFAFIAVLEDCGYMARAAFLMDKIMSRCGLSGKSFIPMLSSVACAVPGILATRVIENKHDRLATILVAPLMSCSARLPVYILMIGAFLTAGFPWWVPGLTMFCMYTLGLVIAPLVALVLKRTLLRGDTPVFLMEMPLYKAPSLRTVLTRMIDSGWAFLRRAGTVILASMVLVWALLYFPNAHPEGGTYDGRIAALSAQLDAEEPKSEAREQIETAMNQLAAQWKEQSILGRVGHAIEPVVRPLGWDWRVGVAALASFPAREVVVGTLGILYGVGKVESDEITESEQLEQHELVQRLRAAEWEGEPGRKVFTIPTALSLMVFFALCCQCASTLAVIRRETGGWAWPIFTFVYMTALAYVGALVTYQLGSLLF